METLQLSVLDLPPQNVLEILPRFKIAVGTRDEIAIAKLAEVIGQIRLDQLPAELAGNGKSDRHMQEVIPIEIKICDRKIPQSIDDSFSGIFSTSENIPEKLSKLRRHGTIEKYLVTSQTGKTYEYQRYVYLDDKKTYRHHHISQKQTEAIAALWHTGASAKEICTALGKAHKSK